jgi:hypothetical protein
MWRRRRCATIDCRHEARIVNTVDDLICAALRGDGSGWPWSDVADTEEFFRRVHVHGVAGLLHARAASLYWPQDVLARLRHEAVQQAMWELRHQQVLIEALNALAEAGVEPVLIKGSALAYSLYDDASLRTRGDTDLLVPESKRAQAEQVLLATGFQRAHGMSGEYVSYQANYTRLTPNGSGHTLDLHWKINNSELLSKLFSYDELRRQAQPVPALCAGALAAGPVHALLIACMHRSTHKQNPYHVEGEAHHTADRLIWLFDIKLLAQRFREGDWKEFARLAQAKGLRRVCEEGMRLAKERLGGTYPEALLAAFSALGDDEKPLRYLEGSKMRQQWMDFGALGPLQRVRFLRELFFPPAEFMLRRHPARGRASLPWLYIGRAAGGVIKALRSRA